MKHNTFDIEVIMTHEYDRIKANSKKEAIEIVKEKACRDLKIDYIFDDEIKCIRSYKEIILDEEF